MNSPRLYMHLSLIPLLKPVSHKIMTGCQQCHRQTKTISDGSLGARINELSPDLLLCHEGKRMGKSGR